MPEIRPQKAVVRRTDTRNRRSAAEATGAARWTFLTNHSHVLVILHAEPDLTLREVAQRVGITERAVQRITQDLEEGGYLKRRRVGRRNEYKVITTVKLRHPIESHRSIGELLDMIVGR